MNGEEKPLICRVCLNIVEFHSETYHIFEKCEELTAQNTVKSDVLISDKICSCANVNIEEGDGLPNIICSNCRRELEGAYKFKQKCEKSDYILRTASIINDTTEDQHYLVKEENDEFNNDFIEDASELQIEDKQEIKEFPQEDRKSNEKNILPSELMLEVLKEKECESESDFFDKVAAAYKIDNSKSKCEKVSPLIDSNFDHNKVQLCDSTLAVHPMNEKTVKKSKAKDLKLECHDCGNLFKSKCKLRVHWKKEHSSVTCPSCGLRFKSFKAYKYHQTNKSKTCIQFSRVNIVDEGKSKKYYCKECHYSTHSRSYIINHLVVHVKEYKYKCKLCDKSFLRHNTLQSHKERAHKQFSGQKMCHICGKYFQGYSIYQSHMRKHREKGKSSQHCEICNKILASKQSLHIHKKLHSNVKVYACDKCPGRFHTGVGLYSHKKIHEDKYYTCKICGYKLKNPYKIKKHENEHKPYNTACSVCGQFHDNDAQLEMHMKRHVDRKHVCSYCDNTYCLRKTLTEHLRKMHSIYVSSYNLDSKNSKMTNNKLKIKK